MEVLFWLPLFHQMRVRVRGALVGCWRKGERYGMVVHDSGRMDGMVLY